MSTVTKPRAPTVRRQLREAKRFSWTGFAVTVGASLLGTLVPAAIGAGPDATLISTLVVTVLAAGGFTAKDGSARGIKAIAIVLLATGALVLTVTGVTVLDLVRGRPATFPGVPEVAAEPRVIVPESVTCPETPVHTTTTCVVAVRSVGASALRVSGIELDSKDFTVDASACVGHDVEPGRRCTLLVTFTPAWSGDRVTDLTIHHNVPGPAAFVELTGRGG
ncbi:Ig-like domain-containing protein [Amycolatopsis sp. NPDC004772]